MVDELDQSGGAYLHTDFAAQQLTEIGERLFGCRVRPAARQRQQPLEDLLQAAGKGGAAADLRDLDHLHQERWQVVGVVGLVEGPTEDQHHGAERRLTQVTVWSSRAGPVPGGAAMPNSVQSRRRDNPRRSTTAA